MLGTPLLPWAIVNQEGIVAAAHCTCMAGWWSYMAYVIYKHCMLVTCALFFCEQYRLGEACSHIATLLSCAVKLLRHANYKEAVHVLHKSVQGFHLPEMWDNKSDVPGIEEINILAYNMSRSLWLVSKTLKFVWCREESDQGVQLVQPHKGCPTFSSSCCFSFWGD